MIVGEGKRWRLFHRTVYDVEIRIQDTRMPLLPFLERDSGDEADKQGIISIICTCIVTRIAASGAAAQNAVQLPSSQRLGGSTDGQDRGVAYLRHHHAQINIRPR